MMNAPSPVADPSTPQAGQFDRFYLWSTCLVAALGGLLFGYDWVVISGADMSVAVFAMWTGCFTLTYSFPELNRKLGAAGTFWIYAGICVAGWFFTWAKLPETKGKTLEQIERELVD